MVQLAIFTLSTLALWLLSDKRAGRWGWIAGIAAQPFWLYATWHAEQWGIFANSIIYTGLYVRGLVNHWNPQEPVHG